jgi:hypothetical protein
MIMRSNFHDSGEMCNDSREEEIQHSRCDEAAHMRIRDLSIEGVMAN